MQQQRRQRCLSRGSHSSIGKLCQADGPDETPFGHLQPGCVATLAPSPLSIEGFEVPRVPPGQKVAIDEHLDMLECSCREAALRSSVMNLLAMSSRLTAQVSQHCVSHPGRRDRRWKRWNHRITESCRLDLNTDPKLNTAFEDAIGLLGRLGTLLAHIQAAVNQHPQVPLWWAAFQPLFPKPVALHGVAVAQVQDLALGLVEPHTIDLGPSIQPVQVPLQSLPTLKQINTPTQLGVICKLTESALDLFVQIIGKDVKQDWPQHKALGNTACDRPPTGVNSIHHHSLGPAIQPVLYPAKSPPVQAMSSQFLQEQAVGNRVKGFTEV
ncbi:hypothetical protein QYF61_011607 [Mycteria americana]|uniref:Uncharacterized protein n=1 Tax=Mycteria americana TaxID=33587 RepID=A0AAN7NJP1_MYCAM|nr:hypothetical protein QYF61_011607 [Mycteria americana]